MNYLDLLKRAWHITWRCRALWIFGFFLALCGGGGGGGGGNFNFPGGGGSSDGRGGDGGGFGDLPGMPDISPGVVIAIIVGVVCLVILLAALGIVVRAVTRTALIGMARQAQETDKVTITEGWRLGWSAGAWRLFLVNLVIDVPLTILTLLLIGLALSPLLLILANKTALTVVGVIIAVFAFIFVILLLILIGVVIKPIQELTWRRTVLDRQGVIDSLRDIVGLARRHFKEVAITWLLMFGIGLGWGVASVLIMLPVVIIVGVVLGLIPAGAAYLISGSWIAAVIAGVPLTFLGLIVVGSAVGGFYLVYESTVWTLAYLDLQGLANKQPDQAPAPETLPADAAAPL
ncbi:MAG: hypothetical protein EHM12_07130 [Dehalococcoidia bacterium]|nr:MAG: hypothetical protein EHM12_07130 [Dehalococcoidia bacterium]